MSGSEEYLLKIRNMVGPEFYIIVPNTDSYERLIDKLGDKYFILKQPNMDLSKYARVIKKK